MKRIREDIVLIFKPNTTRSKEQDQDHGIHIAATIGVFLLSFLSFLLGFSIFYSVLLILVWIDYSTGSSTLDQMQYLKLASILYR